MTRPRPRLPRPPLLLAALGAAVILALGLSAGHASAAAPRAGTPRAAATLPAVPTELSAPAASLKVRPSSIFYTGDGTGVLTGASIGKSGLRWSSWTASRALGTGDNQLNNCTPDCAGGTFDPYKVRLEAWKPATLHGHLVFTRLTIWYTATRPAGSPAHYTFTDLYQDGGWGFSPPTTAGYCTHTEGQPKAAGCANINTLPPAS